jgi:hypothetical protein
LLPCGGGREDRVIQSHDEAIREKKAIKIELRGVGGIESSSHFAACFAVQRPDKQ